MRVRWLDTYLFKNISKFNGALVQREFFSPMVHKRAQSHRQRWAPSNFSNIKKVCVQERLVGNIWIFLTSVWWYIIAKCVTLTYNLSLNEELTKNRSDYCGYSCVHFFRSIFFSSTLTLMCKQEHGYFYCSILNWYTNFRGKWNRILTTNARFKVPKK